MKYDRMYGIMNCLKVSVKVEVESRKASNEVETKESRRQNEAGRVTKEPSELLEYGYKTMTKHINQNLNFYIPAILSANVRAI
jgi:hypothetical protein